VLREHSARSGQYVPFRVSPDSAASDAARDCVARELSEDSARWARRAGLRVQPDSAARDGARDWRSRRAGVPHSAARRAAPGSTLGCGLCSALRRAGSLAGSCRRPRWALPVAPDCSAPLHCAARGLPPRRRRQRRPHSSGWGARLRRHGAGRGRSALVAARVPPAGSPSHDHVRQLLAHWRAASPPPRLADRPVRPGQRRLAAGA
jgi:hypothetical protein